MTYKETLDFLFSQLPAYHRIGKAAYKNNLDNTNALDLFFGHPHTKYQTIHIAGTNGKGSVSHMLASILSEAGYKTGLYTSPHLKDFRERIKINGKMIPRKKVISFVSENRNIIESMRPSFFEMTVAMAFDFFAGEKIDVAVVETGLGGRLDSTNIISPVLSVITNIGHDHMDLLGNTPSAIAAEKAGIIKKGAPVVIGETQPEISDVFISAAKNSGAEIFFADQHYSCDLSASCTPDGFRKYGIFDNFRGSFVHGSIPLAGDYQVKNLVTVWQAAMLLAKDLQVSEQNIIEGIRKVIVNTGLQGRWQIIGNSPLVICDTGHNREGLEYVTRQIASIGKKKLRMVIGFVSDKDLSLVLPLFPHEAEYYFTKASVPRALDEEVLMNKARGFGLTGRSFPDVRQALRTAIKESDAEDLVFVGGSTFVVADVI